ncbi:T9SS type A sorting domain-containing protein [uncultured Kordia sp.]|uniref:T9SS type A sorting domain-containing protein n=1 Tax=uncultured Kordia sp. TaxID=507699 RepID=UPI00261DC6FC|nr:T9SS type A sorting domain-containing protein [uncultured Kordia sp.]
MKTKLLVILCAAFGALQINAQCSRAGSFVQSDPAYSISGTASLTFTTGGAKDVIFDSNFMTVQGLDLRVYLSKLDDILAPGADPIEVTTGPLLGDNGMTSPVLSPITGMKTFSINQTMYPNVNLSSYDYIVIQCIGINERWGYVNMGTVSGPDCTLLSVNEKSLSEAVKVFPNPANDYFEISNDSQNEVSITVYDILGNKVIASEPSRVKKQSFSLANLNSGVYLVQLKSNDQRAVKKLIKR